MTKNYFLKSIMLIIGMLLMATASQAQIYVNSTAGGANNGSSWANAYTDLQTALAAAVSPNEIWVAAGTYYPTSGTDRSISFVMKNNLAIYGGFDGTEDPLTFDLADRDFVANETILSGDIGTTGDFSDNSFHVVSNFNNSLDHTAILDGFTISGGNADGPNPNNIGGGMRNGGSSPLVSNCLFVGNSASYSGGGMSNFSASPTVINCAFIGNFSNQYGGGMQNDNNCSTTVINCSFSGNSAGNEGGAMDNFNNCNTTIGNSIFWGNSSEITNTGNSFLVIDNSIIEDGCPGINATCNDVIAQNPLFMHQPSIGLGASGDLSLQDCSPALDTGDDTFNTTTSDLSGNPRKFDAIPGGSLIDMGAYERKQVAFNGSILYVNHTATGANSGTSWDDAFTTLSEAMIQSCPNVAQIWVAAGTYYPTSGTDRSISFVMKNNLAIYGGFDGTEDPLTFDLADRDFVANETILSGDIGTTGDLSDNSFHVVSNFNNSLDQTAILDGFTISGGNADGPNPNNIGGGMRNVGSSPLVSNCLFVGNSASYSGGGMSNFSASPTVINCAFIGNFSNQYGGGMQNDNNCSTTVINCSFSGNSAGNEGGAMDNFNNCNTTIGNSIFWGNSSEITNTGNSFLVIDNSIIEDGCPGINATCNDVIAQNPLFMHQPSIGLGASGDLSLQDCSPALDTGDDTFNTTTSDLSGNPRKFDAIPGGSLIDMGAYERKQVAFNGSILYVNHTATGANSGTSWDDAFTTLSEAMLQSCPNVAQIWVAAGTYYPTSGTDRSISFVMKNNLAIYGGFDGTEDPLTFDLADRDFVANETILSGEIGDQGTTADNSYTVVSGTGTNATAILDGFTITAGNANAGGGTVPDSRGGGMFIGDNSSPIISNCKFYLNSADFGGGIYNRNNTATVFTECSFISNSATHWGGAMLNESENSIILEECTFQGNTANFGGGIFSRFNTTLTLTNCLFEENSSTSTGGAIYTESDLIVNNCAFNQNSSSSAGGAIYNYSNNATITSSSFTENYALYVGGAIMTHAPAGQEVNISVSESSFQSNSTTYGGGAVNHGYANSEGTGLFECSNCTFTNNVAFDGNTLGGGGAFFNEAIGFDGLFTNCLFDGNKGLGTEDWGGGTFLIFEGNCTIINSTIVNSESATVGGAISVWSENSTLELVNTVLWDNTAASNNSIFNGNGGTANVEYSLIQEDACPANINCGSGMLFGVDPLFVSPADFHLQACSPAVDKGTNTGAPSNDLDGNPRPFDAAGFGAVADMGAYEYSEVINDYCTVCAAVAGTLTKSPDEEMVCEGSDVSATLSEGLYGNGTDELEFRTHDGTAWSAWAEYTSGTAISTAGIAEVEIRTRRLSDHCDPSEYQTTGWLVQWPPVAFAGQDASILPGDNYSLSDATATGNSSILWETSGDGSFDDDSAQNPTYTPGTNDKLTGSVELSISLEDMNLCGFTDSDQMTLTIYRPPTIEITSPFDGDVFYDNPVSAQGTAADPDGDLTEVYLRVNNGLWAPATGTDNWTMDLALEAGENLIQAKAVDAQGLESDVSEVTVILSIQIISIPQGWSLISSYLTPNDPALEMLMQDVSIPENLTIMLGLNGIFWPGYGINTIGNWNILEGYKVKYQQPVELTIRGNKLNDNSVTFPAGFHYIPVLSNVPSPVSEVFSDPANDLKYMFDITSGQIYWPMGGIQTLTTLFPGKGYLANFNKQVTLNFPEYQALKSSTVAANFVSGQDGPWTYAKTGEVHFISLGAQAIDALEQYAYIGAFKSDGICIGLADITTKDQNILLAIYGNDPHTGIKAGAEAGELITFKAWDPADGLATELVVVFDPSFPNHDGSFAINGLSAILDFKENSTGIGVPALISQISMYPNPADDHVNISINGNDLEVNYSIMDMEGRLMQQSEFSGDEFRLDVSNFKPGLYMIRFEIEGELFVRRIVVM
jgi:predicted outer membrane repeat protein